MGAVPIGLVCAAFMPAGRALAGAPTPIIRPPDPVERRELEEARLDAEASWKPDLERALALSKDPERLKDALDAYELAIDELPAYADSVETLGAFSEVFYQSLLKRHPEMGGEAGRFVIGHVAGPLMLLRPQGEEFRTRRYDPIDSDVADSERLEEKERRMATLSRLLERAKDFVGRPASQSARIAWQRVDAVQPGNWEARFYLAQLKAPPASAPPPKAEPAPRKPVPALAAPPAGKPAERLAKRKLRSSPKAIEAPPIEALAAEPPAAEAPVSEAPPAATEGPTAPAAAAPASLPEGGVPDLGGPEGAVPLLGEPAPR